MLQHARLQAHQRDSSVRLRGGTECAGDAGRMQTVLTRNLVCLCVDRSMLVPALFVAWTAQSKLLRSSSKYQVIVFTGAGDATPEDKAWALRHGVTISDNLELSEFSAIRSPLKRLTSATLAGCYYRSSCQRGTTSFCISMPT